MAEQLDLPGLEERIQEYWSSKSVYRRVCEARRGGERFYFLQGPPFTSGKAHIGHAWNTALKDFVLRYKTMQSFDVYRRGGWDMHGLPTEVKVEEEVLGTRTKKDIEEYGLGNFIQECKKYSIKHMNAMTDDLKRLGAWLDWNDPYMTMNTQYMESVWYLIKKASEKDLLYSDTQVIHWCPRCETAVSGYEVKDEYRDVSDPSIYVKAQLEGREEKMLVWTTTPWTLPGNTAIAVHPDYTYAKVAVGGEKLVFVKELLDKVLDCEYKVLEEIKGSELEGLKYKPFLDIPLQKDVNRRIVLAPELVLLEEGTGAVHIAPGHGEEDYRVGREHKLDELCPVDESGKFDIEPYNGVYARDANKLIIETLSETGVLYKSEQVSHRYPHCWRCKTPLIQRLTNQWFLAVSKIRDKILENNEKIKWIPEYIGSGRFRNWVENAKDWCISRQRYWNTPLPVWRCECGEIEVVGSIKELVGKASTELDPESIDLHRPFIDEINLKCKCGKEMTRVKDVLDVWLDSGSASWATLNYPAEDKLFNELYPADFITEGSDQTRGWFYSLLVASTIAFDTNAYNSVLYHGFTLDAEGRKMSKSLGNVVAPMDVINRYGADAFRFYVLGTTPWEDLRFNMEGLEAVHRLLNILWNAYSFSETYMKLDRYNPKKEYEITLGVEDKWILSRYNSLVKEVTEAMENVYPHEACRLIQDFIVDLSRVYIKLVRDRVWIQGEDPRKYAVYHTLHDVLSGLCRLMAPVTPHLTEHLYRELAGEDSIHLADWPKPNEDLIDKKLEEEVATALKIAECAAAARQKAKIKLRWPIARVIVALKDGRKLDKVEDLILKLCNAKELQTKDIEVDLIVKPNYQVLGPKHKNSMNEIVKALTKADADEVEEAINREGEYKLSLKGGEVKLTEEDLVFETKFPEDVVAEEFDSGVVYIDSKLDDKLYSEAMAREVIRRIQEMRKILKLNELQEVMISVKCSQEFRRYVDGNKDYIESETRSKIDYKPPEGEGLKKTWKIEEEDLDLLIKS